MDKIKIVIADDQQLIRESLQIVLNLEEDLEVIGVASNGQEVIEFCQSIRPDVILMDIDMPIIDGVEATRLIKQQYPSQKIIILTSYQRIDYVVKALNYKAEGYLLKAIQPKNLAASIRLIYGGESLVSKEMAEAVVQQLLQEKENSLQNLNQYGLTEREVQILVLLSRGCTNREIAEQLFLSEGTVKNYVSNIYSKLEVKGRREAKLKALNEGLIKD